MANHANGGRLKAAIVPVTRLRPEDKAAMFALMRRYYDGTGESQFLSDLGGKDKVILLTDTGGSIKGFSTLSGVRVRLGGKTLRGVFSGDTVIEKQYWGQRALGRAFLRHLLMEKLKSPMKPLYWLLISKGYKTYLMMANNFSEHYPRYEKPTPPGKQALMDAFYASLYPDHYDANTGLIFVSDQPCRLKNGVAGISVALSGANPRIAFFQKANPRWYQGVELACIARMTVWMPFYYGVKVFLKDRLLKFARLVPTFPKKEGHANE